MLSSTFWHVLAERTWLVVRTKTCSKVFLLFARLVCANHIFNKRKLVRAHFSKNAFAKSSFARLVCARPKRYGHTAHTFSRLLSDILIWERFISISSRFQMTWQQYFLGDLSCWFNNLTETINHVFKIPCLSLSSFLVSYVNNH